MTPDPRTALQEHFGFDGFRGRQEEVVQHVLAGRDALVIMATGDGKSLCYQLPALMLDGLTLVVSPLIALMDDQVAALRKKGLPATCVHSMLDADQREARLQAVRRGEVKLLYVTPERFRVPGFWDQLEGVAVARLAIDEAHCVSHWGHDFRPDYKELGKVRARLGHPPCLALTATATPAVQEDIRATLDMGDAKLFHTGIERPNLFLATTTVDTEEAKLERIRQVFEEIGGPGIVYFAIIKDLLRVEDELLREGYRPIVYHGKLSAHERRQQQARFLESGDGVVLATNAFGMGVDKADIRFILHHQLPGTLEAYYQEVGRAGRDGKGALCELLYAEPDLSIQRNFVEWANPDREFMAQLVQHLSSLGERIQSVDVQELRETFLLKNRHDGRIETCLNLLRTAGCTRGEPGRDLEWVRRPDYAEMDAWLPEDKRKRDLEGLLAMVRYAGGATCLKRTIHDHFALPLPDGPCGACSVCTPASDWLDRHLPQQDRRPIGRGGPSNEATDVPVERGQWIDVKGHGLCAVKRVHVRKGKVSVDVERARDLTERSFDLHRVRWRPVKG